MEDVAVQICTWRTLLLYGRWKGDGLWEQINEALVKQVRIKRLSVGRSRRLPYG